MPNAKPAPGASGDPPGEGLARPRRTRAFLLLATVLTLGAVTASMICVHLLTFLQAHGLELAGLSPSVRSSGRPRLGAE